MTRSESKAVTTPRIARRTSALRLAAALCLIPLALPATGQDAATAATDEAASEETAPEETASEFADAITVRAASRRPQRIVEAPAAVTALGPEAIERRAPFGQVPRLFADVASVELAQGGLFDFNLNTRGFNGSTNRRMLTLIDGRDPSQPVFSGAEEWATLSFGLEDLSSAELVHGPGAALYGAGAFNGVLDLRTKAASDSRGGRLRLAGGEIDTRRVEGRYGFGGERLGHFRLSGGHQESEDFMESRVAGGEYADAAAAAALPTEVIPPPSDTVILTSGALRWDRALSPSLLLVAEGGTGRAEGAGVVTGLGRLQRQRVQRTWGRIDLSSPRWNLLGTYTGRDSDREVSLSAGSAIFLDSYRAAVEGQVHTPFADGRGRLVGGASWTGLRVDSADDAGRQTLFLAPVSSEHRAVFGQGEYDLTGRLHAVVSARWDDSDLHDDRISPRAALLWAVGDSRSLRLTWSQAFQSSTLAEKNLRVPVAPPLDLSPLEEALAPLLGGVSLGLDAVPLLAVGSEDLDVEEVTTWEIGYQGTVGGHTFLTASAYRSRLEDFTTNLVPALGTSLGPLVDPPLWQPPAGLSPEAAAAVRAALAAALPPGFLLAMDAQGRPYVPLLSFGSFGQVDTQGVEVASSSLFGRWRVDASASWFDFDVESEAAVNPLSPNRATWRAAAGLSWIGERLDSRLSGRWSEGFDYRSGIFVGPVPSYQVFDLTLGYRWDDHWSLGLAVANLFDDSHYEAFGGDLLRRRTLASVAYSW